MLLSPRQVLVHLCFSEGRLTGESSVGGMGAVTKAPALLSVLAPKPHAARAAVFFPFDIKNVSLSLVVVDW